MSRTMVRASRIADGFEFRTYSRGKGLSEGFYVFRSTFEDLEQRGYTVQISSGPYAEFQRNNFDGTVKIRFVWLNRSGNRLSGEEETVVVSYESLMTFVRINAQADGPVTWRELDISLRKVRPRLVFRCHERLRECLDNKTVRRKLVKFLRNNFNWPYSERIEFYTDFVPYSFSFQEFCGGKNVMCGGVILHGQEDMSKAYYSIHT